MIRGYGIGASVARKEDDRHLRGQGEFVADIRQHPGHHQAGRTVRGIRLHRRRSG
jgi:hypothetical protein